MRDEDKQLVLQVWLNASIIAHHFIPISFWHDELESMRDIYLPSADNFVYLDDNNQVKGFISLCDDLVAALFVAPSSQGLGIGKKLLEKAKSFNHKLRLSVYKENIQAINFYQKQGFFIKNEQNDSLTNQLELIMHWKKR